MLTTRTSAERLAWFLCSLFKLEVLWGFSLSLRFSGSALARVPLVYRVCLGRGDLVTNGGALGPAFSLPRPSWSLQTSSSHLLFSWQSHWLWGERDQDAPSPACMLNGDELTR